MLCNEMFLIHVQTYNIAESDFTSMLKSVLMLVNKLLHSVSGQNGPLVNELLYSLPGPQSRGSSANQRSSEVVVPQGQISSR